MRDRRNWRAAVLTLGVLVFLTLRAWGQVAPPAPSGPQSSPGVSAPGGASERSDLILCERELGVMGTSLHIKVLGHDEAALRSAIDASVEELHRIEDLMTDWRPSPLEALNAAAGAGPASVPCELAAIIARGQEVGRMTGGAFDITFAAVGALWKFKLDGIRRPTQQQISEALAFVGFERVQVNPQTCAVDLPRGMRIGLGGIAKGYGVDRAMQVLRERGVEHAIVNAGGDMKVLGLDRGKPWEIAVRHPRQRERAIAVLRISNQCVVTSGDYERYFELDGQRYHHIIDPRTGHPSTGCMSATVVGPSAELCDALATSLCVLGAEAGKALVERISRVEALLVDPDGAVHATSGLLNALR